MSIHQRLHSTWYALQIRTKLIKASAKALEHKGYEVFLPMYSEFRRRPDRMEAIAIPLFPGYLFCRFDTNERLLPILTTPGVISIVSVCRIPAPVPEEEIEAVRTIVLSDLRAAPHPAFPAGTKVTVERGPLAGVKGQVVTQEKGCRLIVSIELLQRAVMVEIERDWLRAASPAPTLPAQSFKLAV